MKTISKLIKQLLDNCPYTIAGKKCIKLINGNKNVSKKYLTKTLKYRNGLKTGRNISLVGIFCPFFWYALLTGMNQKIIILNAIHSSIVITIGLIVVIINYSILLYHKRSA